MWPEAIEGMVPADFSSAFSMRVCGVQLMAVVPISILLILVMAIFFGRGVTAPMELLFGMLSAILGLALFIDALRVCVMPLSEQLGTDLPKTLSLPCNRKRTRTRTLSIACFSGVCQS